LTGSLSASFAHRSVAMQSRVKTIGINKACQFAKGTKFTLT